MLSGIPLLETHFPSPDLVSNALKAQNSLSAPPRDTYSLQRPNSHKTHPNSSKSPNSHKTHPNSQKSASRANTPLILAMVQELGL